MGLSAHHLQKVKAKEHNTSSYFVDEIPLK